MRLFRRLPFALCLLVCSFCWVSREAWGQQANPQLGASDTKALQAFHSDVLHLTYQYPTSFVDAGPLVGAAFQASLSSNPATAGDAGRCITLPFSRMRTREGGLELVLLVRVEAACLKKNFTADSLPELTRGEAQGLAAAGAKTSFGDPVRFETGGQPASMAEGMFTLPTGQALYGRIVCVLRKPDVACWQFLSKAAASLGEMGKFPVAFDGGAMVPLVPGSVEVKPQQ